MAFAILRIEKVKSVANAAAKTGHNYRLHPVPNADASRQGLNQELVNHAQRPLWELAEARVAALGLKRLRADAVKAVEVLLTASPEAFPRDAQGLAQDMRRQRLAGGQPAVSDRALWGGQRGGPDSAPGRADAPPARRGRTGHRRRAAECPRRVQPG